jgi:hypothetical protein
MTFRRRSWISALVGAAGLALATAASAQVVVTVDGNVAHADISLEGPGGQPYDAEVTIDFDDVTNLSPESLNLTAEIVDPSLIQSRIDAASGLCGGSVDAVAAFPMIITVEPPVTPWLFEGGFDGGGAAGPLELVNTYSFEIHTHNLSYLPGSPYRIWKAPIGGVFEDITEDIESGSVRARGRHGQFSQFVIVADTRGHSILLPGVLCPVFSEKTAALNAQILGAIIGDLLRLDLLRLVAKIVALLALDLGAALDATNELIATIDADAGTEIPNVWHAGGDVTNSAGQMKGTAEALRYAIQQAIDAQANP